MMPDHTASRHACCQLTISKTTTYPRSSGLRFTLIEERGDQEWDVTDSRQLRRGSDFLAAARYMVRHHPKAGPTTLRLAAAFAARMHRSQHGHIAFNVSETINELGVSRRTVLAHARYLRELGLIAWVEHGSKRNVLRTREGHSWGPGDGYRGTATIYAPVAPPAWDQAQGHRIRGTGYQARLIGYTDKGRVRAIAKAKARQDHLQPGRTASRRCTPSVVGTSAPSRLQVGTEERKNTRRPRLGPVAQHRPRTLFTATECQQAIALTEQVQREVWWIYKACSRRIAYALRPLIAAGWSAPQLAAELATWGVPARLKDPAAYLRHELRRRQHHGELPHTEFAARDLAVDNGTRYEAMLRDRTRHAPAWQRYIQLTQPVLRERLVSQRRRRRNETATYEYRPTLREPVEDFLASLPNDTWADAPTPREIYAARARGEAPRPGRALPPPDRPWLQHLREHAEAAQVCEGLRMMWQVLPNAL
ncbi:hypothetical protein ACLQ18_43035 [Streptomyces sp. DT193]|uniref:hypothetical protein n=1 Tax=Streptomyces sp. DT193 TaxID=3393418 RepID=UPI003CF87170